MEKLRFQSNSRDGYMGMLEYYQNPDNLNNHFDPILLKYDIPAITEGILQKCLNADRICPFAASAPKWEDYPFDSNELKGLSTTEEKRELIRVRVYNDLMHYEASNELTSLTKKDFSRVMGNLFMTYHAGPEQVRQQVQLIDLISRRVISEYIRIDGLERLFSEQYVDFEWEMHLGMDHNIYQMDFYRDHFLHQVRDAYMMDRLLRDGGFYTYVLTILDNPGASKVSQYFHKMRLCQERLIAGHTNAKYLQYDPEFVPRNIIYMASYMAGLFHDIGYPETYLRSLNWRIRSFLPGMHPGNTPSLPDNLFSLLQNSLLFRVVPYSEIMARVQNEEIDHGTLSALAFLLHFYQNGEIFQMEPYKTAAVELAALAIYNHTFNYGVAGEEKPDDWKPRFLTNPIAYLLRLCDDLQEWDRVYFEISSKPALLTCRYCNTPAVPKTITKNDSRMLHYVCNCCETHEKQLLMSAESVCRTFDGRSSFPRRQLYNVQVCDWVEAEYLNQERTDLLFRLYYDPYRLLNIAYINTGYANYRISELNTLKHLMIQQSGLPRLWLEYYVTANPILLKTMLLRDYVEWADKTFEMGTLGIKNKFANSIPPDIAYFKDPQKYNKELLNTFRKQTGFVLRKIYQNLIDPYWKIFPAKPETKRVLRRICNCVKLYVRLLLYWLAFEIIKQNDLGFNRMDPLRKDFADRYALHPDTFRCLLGDSLLQIKRICDADSLRRLRAIPDIYMHQFQPGNWMKELHTSDGNDCSNCSEGFYETALQTFIDRQKYQPPALDDASDGIDAFTDLVFFQYLHEKMGEKCAESDDKSE